MHNYTNNKHAVWGMMSRGDELLDDADKPYYLLRKNSKKVVLLPKRDKLISVEDIRLFFKSFPSITKIGLNYLTKDNVERLTAQFRQDKIKHSKSRSTLLVSKFNKEFFELSGKQHREFRETRNSLNKQLYFKVNEAPEILQPKVAQLIEWWDEVHGPKYGWQRHSGYDRAFFDRIYPEKKNEIICLSFYETSSNNFIGYSVISNKTQIIDNKPTITYIIRKCNTEKRNTTLFIDFTTFKWARENIILGEDEFFVNWGASSGGVLKYKQKFPIAALEPAYFISLKRENFK